MKHIEEKLEAAFSEIEKNRMQNIPLCNPVLEVKAIGFRLRGEYYFGVMLTPWFMNLMLIPREPWPQKATPLGSKTLHAFPSGRFEFVHAEEDLLGPYQVCSLFSPMFEFDDQQKAVSTAEEVIAAIMETPGIDEASKPDAHHENTINRRQFLRTLLSHTEANADER